MCRHLRRQLDRHAHVARNENRRRTGSCRQPPIFHRPPSPISSLTDSSPRLISGSSTMAARAGRRSFSASTATGPIDGFRWHPDPEPRRRCSCGCRGERPRSMPPRRFDERIRRPHASPRSSTSCASASHSEAASRPVSRAPSRSCTHPASDTPKSSLYVASGVSRTSRHLKGGTRTPSPAGSVMMPPADMSQDSSGAIGHPCRGDTARPGGCSSAGRGTHETACSR